MTSSRSFPKATFVGSRIASELPLLNVQSFGDSHGVVHLIGWPYQGDHGGASFGAHLLLRMGAAPPTY